MGVGVAVGALTFAAVLIGLMWAVCRSLRGSYAAWLIPILPLSFMAATLCGFLAAPWWPATLIVYALAGLAAALF